MMYIKPTKNDVLVQLDVKENMPKEWNEVAGMGKGAGERGREKERAKEEGVWNEWELMMV